MVKNWLLIISFIFLGCFEQENSSDLILPETFKSILKDIYGDQGLRTFKHISSDTIQKLLNETLERHQVNDTSYKRTLLFYIERPDSFIQIIQEIEKAQ